MATTCCRYDGRSIVARSYRDIANATVADQSGADQGEPARAPADVGCYSAQFESAGARYCAEGVTPSPSGNVAYIGNR
jgi:hypothetical protein